MTANSIVVVMDGLRAQWLGPYGNTWFDTPMANRLGAESMLFEQCISDGPALPVAYRSFWRGASFDDQGAQLTLAGELQQAGVSTCLISDEPELNDWEDIESFADFVQLPPALLAQSAADVESTAAAQLVAAAYETALESPQPFHLWLHLQALAGLWDAPYQLRAELGAADDPLPPSDVIPPSGPMDTTADPDAWFGWLMAAAGQVRVLDACLGWLTDLSAQTDALLCVTAPRGFPLGEHGVAGLERPPLHNELLHVPLMVRYPNGAAAAARQQSLVQGAALHDVIRRYHGVAPGDQDFAGDLLPKRSEQLAVSVAEDELAIRTAAWAARFVDDQIQLYSKPDDRMEVNEVANRCAEEVEALMTLMAAIESGERFELPEAVWKVSE